MEITFTNLASDILGVVISLLFISGSGIYLQNLKIVNKDRLKNLSKICEQLFMPCLIFSSFVSSLDISDIGMWGPVLLISILNIAQGCFLGYLLNKFFLKNKDLEGIIIISCGLGMTTNIALNLSHNLRDYLYEISQNYEHYESKLEGEKNAEQRAITYIMIHTLANTIARWTIGKSIFKKLNQNDQKKLEIEMQTINKSLIDDSQERIPAKEPPKDDPIYKNPPIVATFVSIIVNLIPQLRTELITQGTFLNRMILNSAEVLGKISPPFVLLILGANLYNTFQAQQNDSPSTQLRITKKEVISITFIRLLINPILGVILLKYLYSSNLVQDEVGAFINLLQYSTPTAINLLVIATLYTDFEKEISVLLLVGYGLYIFTLPTYMIGLFRYFF